MLTAREDGQWSDAFCWEKPRNHGCRAGRRLAPACARRASPPLLAAPKPARVAPLYSGANTAPNTPRNNAFCAPSLPRKSESSTRLCGNPRGERPRNAELTAGSSSEAVNATLSAPPKCRFASARARKRPQNAERPRTLAGQLIDLPQSQPSEVTNSPPDALRIGGTVENTSNILTIKEVAAICAARRRTR
jgi:hypothetical protein